MLSLFNCTMPPITIGLSIYLLHIQDFRNIRITKKLWYKLIISPNKLSFSHLIFIRFTNVN